MDGVAENLSEALPRNRRKVVDEGVTGEFSSYWIAENFNPNRTMTNLFG